MAGNKSTGFQLFTARLIQEHRLAEFRLAVRRRMRDTGDTAMAARAKVSREFGYTNTQDELARLEFSKRAMAYNAIDRADDAVIAEQTIERSRRKFEQVFLALPETAPFQVEIDWIRSHPAMTRKVIDPELEKVVLTVEDILNAPSRSAVIALQNWANNPQKFLEKILDEHKKKGTEDSKSTVLKEQVDDDLSEAEALLRGLAG